jgi:hypothetical protein
MDSDKDYIEKKVDWEQPKLEVLKISITSNGDNDVLDEDTFLGWLVGGAS